MPWIKPEAQESLAQLAQRLANEAKKPVIEERTEEVKKTNCDRRNFSFTRDKHNLIKQIAAAHEMTATNFILYLLHEHLRKKHEKEASRKKT